MLEHQIAITIFKDETQSLTFYIEQILFNTNCHIFLQLDPENILLCVFKCSSNIFLFSHVFILLDVNAFENRILLDIYGKMLGRRFSHVSLF